MKKMNTKKYKYSIRMSETKTVFGHTLHRIVALRRVGGFFGVPVNPGDDGGWIENESCLSQDGECWVADEACVFGNAKVLDDARIMDRAMVYGRAFVYGQSLVMDDARVYDSARISGIWDTRHIMAVDGYSRVHGCSEIINCTIVGKADVNNAMFTDSSVFGEMHICPNKGHWTESVSYANIGSLHGRYGVTDPLDILTLHGIRRIGHVTLVYDKKSGQVKVNGDVPIMDYMKSSHFSDDEGARELKYALKCAEKILLFRHKEN